MSNLEGKIIKKQNKKKNNFLKKVAIHRPGLLDTHVTKNLRVSENDFQASSTSRGKFQNWFSFHPVLNLLFAFFAFVES